MNADHTAAPAGAAAMNRTLAAPRMTRAVNRVMSASDGQRAGIGPAEHGRPPCPAPLEGTPGRCSEHGYELVTPSRLGLRWDPRPGVRICCPSGGHTPYDRDRCLWCGGPLWFDERMPYNQSTRRRYCPDRECRRNAWIRRRWDRARELEDDVAAATLRAARKGHSAVRAGVT